MEITTSLIISLVFGKRYDNILRDIYNLAYRKESTDPNFGESSSFSDRLT